MTLPRLHAARRHGLPLLLAAGVLVGIATLGPPSAAHGPDGAHDHGLPAASRAAAAWPRIETASEAFELVAELRATELVIVVDRYATNEPVLGASLEIESGALKAKAVFRPADGDYVVTDAAMLAALRAPGEHPLVMTLIAGRESDLLEGKLVSSATPRAAHDPGEDHPRKAHERTVWLVAAAAAILTAGLLLRRSRRRARGLPPSGLALVLALSLCVPAETRAGPGAHGPNGEHLDGSPATVSPQGLARLPDGSVNLPKAAQRRMGVRTTISRPSDMSATIELTGRVIPDPNGSGRVQTMHGGRIEAGPRGIPVTGQAVRQGEVLAYVRHHADPYALGAQKAQLAELRAQRRVAEQRVQRLESLEGTVPRKDIEAARADAAGLAERERSIGASLDTREPLTAPVSGVVARVDLVAGQVIEPRDVLIDVVDPTRLLVEAVTADPALATRLEGASLVGMPQVALRLVGASRTLREGMLPIIFAASPTRGTGEASDALPLAIGQPVTVVARSRSRVHGIALPAQALVRNASNEPVVWIKTGAERFAARPVQYRLLDAATIVVTEGLAADARVVIHGASLIAQIR
jgi:hypothetical protein